MFKFISMSYLSLLVFAATSSLALAEDAVQQPSSKENKKLEGQGDISQWLKDINVLSDGSLRVSGIAVLGQNKSSQWGGMEVSLETRLFAPGKETCTVYQNEGFENGYYGGAYHKYNYNKYPTKECDPGRYYELTGNEKSHVAYNAGTLLFPIEATVRIPFVKDQDGRVKDVDLNSLKAGIVRLLLSPIGMNFQFGSYLYKNFDFGYGQSHAFEPMSATFNNVIIRSQDEKLEIVLKGTVGGGFNWVRNVGIPEVATTQTAAQNADEPSSVGGLFTTGASIGVRIHQRVLADLFGGLNYLTGTGGKDSTTESTGKKYPNDLRTIQYPTNDYNLLQRYVGGSIRIMPAKWIHILGSGQVDYYDANVTYQTPTMDGTVKGTSTQHATTIKGGVELRW